MTDLERLKEEFYKFRDATFLEQLGKDFDPKIGKSQLDVLEDAIKELQAWQSRPLWRRLLHLKPAKHKIVLKIGGNNE
jgi:hypothetical protein